MSGSNAAVLTRPAVDDERALDELRDSLETLQTLAFIRDCVTLPADVSRGPLATVR